MGVAILMLSGCLPSAPRNNKSGLIAASFYPVYVFALNITDGVEDLQVQCMAEQNVGCLHDYTLTAKDAKLLNDADVLVTNGAGMESFIHDLSETADDIYIVDSSQGIDILCDEGGHSAHSEDHNEEGHSHNHQHSENAHIWMSVENAKQQVCNITDGLCQVYPQYKDAFCKNRDMYIARLNTMQSEMAAASVNIKGTRVITFHNAYEYMAQDMGFEIVSTIESDHGGEPSAKKLAALSSEISEHSVKAMFIEPNYEGSAASILSAETGVDVYTINPVLSGSDVKTAYEDIMRQNIKIILKAVK